MSQFDNKKAAALKYDGGSRAPVVLAAGSGYVAQKIIDVAQESDVPVYQDNSLATLLAQLNVGAEIPPELYQAIVEIYVYFLNYIPEEKRPKDTSLYVENPSQNIGKKLNVVSAPDIKISDINGLSPADNTESKEEKDDSSEKTYTLDQLRAEHDIGEMNINLLEDLLEDF